MLRADMYQRLFHNTPQAILVVASNGQIIQANPAACRMFGGSMEELSRLYFPALFPPEVMPQLSWMLKEETTVGNLVLRVSIHNLKGMHFPVELTLRPIASGKETLLLAYVQDVSEQERIENQLQQQEHILKATRDIAMHLLQTPDVQASLPGILQRIGTTFLAQGVALYKNRRGDGERLQAHLLQAWQAPHVGALHPHSFTYQRSGLQGWAARLARGEGIYGSVQDFPVIEQQFLAQRNIENILVAPVFQGEHWWGMLSIQRIAPSDPWNRNQQESLQIIASMLGEALQRADIEARLRQRQQALEILQRITTDALSEAPAQETLNALAAHLSALVQAEACFITTWDDTNQSPVPAAAYGMLQETYPTLRPPLSGEETLTYLALQRGTTLLIEDLSRSPYQPPSWEAYPQTQAIRSLMVIPMLAGQQWLGAALIAFHQPRTFSPQEQQAAEQATQQVALALAKTRLLRTTRRQLEELRILHHVSLAATRTLDEDTLLNDFVQIVGQAFYREHLAVLLLDEHAENLELRAAYYRGRLSQKVVGSRFPLSQGITGYVARSGETYRSGHVTQDSRYVACNSNTTSEICVPVYAGQRVLGVLNAENSQEEAFDQTDERLLRTLAGQLGTALLQVRLFEAERQRRREAETLQQVSSALVSSLDLDDVLQNIMTLLQRVVPYDSASMVILEDGYPRVMASSGDHSEIPLQILPGLIERPHIVRLLQEKRPVVLADTQQPDSSWMYMPGSEHVRSWLGVPLLVQDRVIGWLNIDKREPNFYTPNIAQLALAFANQAAIALENARLYNELETSYLQTVLALARAMDARDTYTANHSHHLSSMARTVAEKLGCDAEEIQAIEWAAILHDIGKIGVPDHILRKPAALSADEWEIMKRHPEIGAEIIAPVQRLRRVAPIVRAHQEKFDGSGYPRGLKGEQIPLGARILAVVDAYSAITDDRVYRRGRSHQEAMEELRRCAGTHFDPHIVDVFLQLIEQRGAL